MGCGILCDRHIPALNLDRGQHFAVLVGTCLFIFLSSPFLSLGEKN